MNERIRIKTWKNNENKREKKAPSNSYRGPQPCVRRINTGFSAMQRATHGVSDTDSQMKCTKYAPYIVVNTNM